ncbi:MAG: serine hydrolase [Acidobacteria bacterium]|nr:serine hydrolase [Acidobacteriota bacterium]
MRICLWASAALVASLVSVLPAATVFPGKTWEKRRSAQWSEAKLRSARAYAGTLKTAAVVIVQDGAIVDEWGEVTKKYMCHSIRKSFLAELYGVAIAQGKIDPKKTLAELGIDDNEPVLTATEKKATVFDLLKARSGIYHPAVYETASMKAVRPLRGSHAPGTHWYYNNWDFNTLGTIYEKLTGEKIHKAMETRIARPIGMESFTAADGEYSQGSDSLHPAYPIQMTAHDLARFGVLMLNRGSWNGRQILPAKWVTESTTSWSDASSYAASGYGYMWWVDRNSYSARGAGGHYVAVVPGMNLVVVHRVDTFVPGSSVSQEQFFRLLDMIVDAGGRRDLAPVAESKEPPACLLPNAACAERLYSGEKHITFYRTHSPQTGTYRDVKRAMIMVHGAARNGDTYFGVALASAAAGGRLQETVLLAPHFRANSGACSDAVEPAEYAWTCEDWKVGYPAVNSAEGKPAHSFDFIDGFIRLLNNRERFPNLREIVVAGHSAGGQFVQRYAALTRVESRLPLRFFVANPSSYMYLSDLRISRQGACDLEGNCKGRFVKYWDAENCTTYNKYKHGLEAPAGYAALVPPERIRAQFVARDVTYLVGALDANQDPDLESTCNATAQGFNRRERGLIFWNYMKQTFKAQHKAAVVSGCGHSATCMFVSPATVQLLYPSK